MSLLRNPWPGPGVTGLSCALCAIGVLAQMPWLTGVTGRLLAAALVLLLYLVFCVVIWFGYRHQHRATAKQSGTVDQATELLIVFASQTGFAEQLALKTVQMLKDGGIDAALCHIAQLNVAQLLKVKRALFIVSTTGEGDAPDSAVAFTRKVMQQTIALDGLSYGVLALGDRSYVRYCAFGHALDHWLRHHGARACFDLIEVDNGDVGALRHWQYYLGVLSGHTQSSDWSLPHYTRWMLTARRHLNPGSLGGPVFQLALTPLLPTSSAMLSWQPGDIAEIGARNAPSKVATLLMALQLDGAQAVRDSRGQTLSLAELLARSILPLDLASLTPATISPPLSALALAQRLLPLPHREYSIASLPQDGQLELLVRRIVLSDGSYGLGSGWLTDYLQEGDGIDVRVRENRSFHAPVPDCPLILIGNGTGLAGLRAHMKARIAAGRHRNWLLFGERSAHHDFFYADEITAWHEQGWLQRLDLAFSRDQAHRVYVQDKLHAAAAELRRWLNDGAAIYVCGSLAGMATEVARTLSAIVGEEALEALTVQGRYRRDVY